jgi:hypothetical protein
MRQDENAGPLEALVRLQEERRKILLADDPRAKLQHADFLAYMLEHKYIFTPSGQIWPAASVNARCDPVPDGIGDNGKPKFMAANRWLDQNRPVEQMTWAPGEPAVIADRLIADGGWIPRKGCRVFNLYNAPVLDPIPGNPDPWLHHLERLYGTDAAHIVAWCAHRVQRPQVKINHALVLGGMQGIGKDTVLEPVKYAVGAWNFHEASPQQMLGRFNSFLKSVVLRVSEARDLGDFDRYAFYDHTKSIIAAPPDTLRVDEKHRAEYYIPNITGVIITTNHKSDGIYLPADDRRHFVAWSDLDRKNFNEAYWNDLWGWYANNGLRVVAHYLLNLDLSGFNPKAPPRQTDAFFELSTPRANPRTPNSPTRSTASSGRKR